MPASLNATFRNCIFWGENGLVDSEVVVLKNGFVGSFNAVFDSCLVKVVTVPANATTWKVINNQPPQFDSINTNRHFYDFHLKSTSPAINKGVNAGILIDLDGKPRPLGPAPDLGCYEKQ